MAAVEKTLTLSPSVSSSLNPTPHNSHASQLKMAESHYAAHKSKMAAVEKALKYLSRYVERMHKEMDDSANQRDEIHEGSVSNNVKMRRRHRRWTFEEEVGLVLGVIHVGGPGNWKAVLDGNKDLFKGRRTTIDLKDKWRNMVRK